MVGHAEKSAKLAPRYRQRPGLNFKIVSLLYLVVSSFIWITGLSLVVQAPKQVNAPVPIDVSQAVWELDSALHRLITSDLSDDDEAAAADKSRVTLAVQKLKLIEKTGTTNFHGALDVIIGAAIGVRSAVENGNDDGIKEHVTRFRDAVVTTQMGITPGEDDEDAKRHDGVAFLVTSGLFLIFGYFVLLRQFSLKDSRYRLLRERTTLDEHEMQSITEKLVATENHVAAMRGMVDSQMQERRRLEADIETFRSEIQRHLLSRSACEREIERLGEVLKENGLSAHADHHGARKTS